MSYRAAALVLLAVLGTVSHVAPGPGGKSVPAPFSPPRPVKEATYQSKTPHYCLLRLGQGPLCRLVWLVFDSVPDPLDPGTDKDLLYVDRNGNGDLTEAPEKVEAVVHEIDTRPSFGGAGPSKVKRLEFSLGELRAGPEATFKDVKVTVHWFQGRKRPCVVEASGKQPYRSEWGLFFSERVEDAPVLHLAGPLTLRFALGQNHALSLTEEFILQAEVGTPGQGAGSFISLSNIGFPEDLHPGADIDFPHREAGRPPIRLTVVLKQRC